MTGRIYLIFKEIASKGFIALIVLGVILIGSFSLGAIALLSGNVNRYLEEKFSTAIPPNIIKVSPKISTSLGFLGFAFKHPKGSILNDEAISQIRAMKGIQSIHPFMASQIPMQAVISFMGLSYRTDLVCIGVTYPYIAGDIHTKQDRALWLRWKPGREMPVLVPNILLDAYNSSMAEPNGLPRITPEMAIGRQLQISFGKSSIKSSPGFQNENATVIGFTPKVANICLVIPIAAARYYNEKFKGKEAGKEYMTAFVQASDHSAYLAAEKKIENMGFVVESEKALSQEVLAVKNNVNLAVGVFGAIVLIISIIAVASATVIATLDRLDYYRILRVLGASRLFLFFSIMVKYAIFGFIGTWTGTELLKLISNNLLHTFSIPGFKIGTILPQSYLKWALLWGTILPIAASIPALAALSSKSLSGD